ncbi:hypothetical protein M3Y95_00874100 [Aphelenchoides besseyi]|nr:hypothetical protein M3Y95_00874100 [Aphelenchoides besseyi]
MDNVGISPCGAYFWSIEVQSLGFHFIPQRIGFRQVDIETLNYVNFEVIGPTFTECKIEDIQLYNTNRGTFLLLHVTETLRRSTKSFDLIYHLHFNMEKQRVHLNHVRLPKLATTGPYPVPYSHSENWRTGLIEQNDSVYFYRVDYFGDLHFVEWEPNSISEWTNLVIHGSKRPKSWVVSTDRNLENHPLDFPNWSRSLHLLSFCSRYYATGGIFYEYDDQKNSTDFFKLNLNAEDGTCECVHMFEVIYFPMSLCPVSTFFNKSNGSHYFLINEKSKPGPHSHLVWELVCINEVPTLRDMAYWTVRQHIRVTKTPEASEPSSQFESIFRFLRVFLWKKKTQKEETQNEEDPNLPEPISFVICSNPKKRILRVSRSLVLHLLKMFNREKTNSSES